MTIDWNAFTPWSALLGGGLIGAAAGLLLLFNGRIAGISGIVGGVFRAGFRGFADAGWRIAFVLGLVAAPLLFALLAPLPQSRIAATPLLLVVAGLLVGLGLVVSGMGNPAKVQAFLDLGGA